jgi:hypothetical protein
MVDIVVKFYYEEAPYEKFKSTSRLLYTNGQGNGLSLKGSYMTTFTKHLLEFDPTFGSKFLK